MLTCNICPCSHVMYADVGDPEEPNTIFPIPNLLVCPHHSLQSKHIPDSSSPALLSRCSHAIEVYLRLTHPTFKAVTPAARPDAALAECSPKHIALAMQRRLSSANRAPSKSRRPPPDINLPMLVDADGNQMVEVEPGVTAPRDAVMAAEGAQSAPGCLSLFNTPGVTSKRFVRISKPAAGSSLTVSLPPAPFLHTCLLVSIRRHQICRDALRSLRAVLWHRRALDTSWLTQALGLAHYTSLVCQIVGKLSASHV